MSGFGTRAGVIRRDLRPDAIWCAQGRMDTNRRDISISCYRGDAGFPIIVVETSEVYTVRSWKYSQPLGIAPIVALLYINTRSPHTMARWPPAGMMEQGDFLRAFSFIPTS